jgi:hypothetical protein
MHNSEAGELSVAAQIIEFRKYQKSRELARMHADIERRLARLREIADRLFVSLRADYDRSENSGPLPGNPATTGGNSNH